MSWEELKRGLVVILAVIAVGVSASLVVGMISLFYMEGP